MTILIYLFLIAVFFPYIKFLDSNLVAYGTFTKAEDNDLIEELESR